MIGMAAGLDAYAQTRGRLKNTREPYVYVYIEIEKEEKAYKCA